MVFIYFPKWESTWHVVGMAAMLTSYVIVVGVDSGILVDGARWVLGVDYLMPY